jgi:hypothetical protein
MASSLEMFGRRYVNRLGAAQGPTGAGAEGKNLHKSPNLMAEHFFGAGRAERPGGQKC